MGVCVRKTEHGVRGRTKIKATNHLSSLFMSTSVLSVPSLLPMHWLSEASMFILAPAFPVSSCYFGKWLKKSSTEIGFSEQLAQPVRSTKACWVHTHTGILNVLKNQGVTISGAGWLDVLSIHGSRGRALIAVEIWPWNGSLMRTLLGTCWRRHHIYQNLSIILASLLCISFY